MLDFVVGLVAQCSPTRAVIDVGGMGLALSIPVSTYERLREAQQRGERARVLTRLQLLAQHEELRLYGFATETERKLFDALLRVQGVGPASALAVLSGSAPADVVHAIGAGDMRFLTRVKGIGKKTAERVIVELREKAHLLIVEPGAAPRPSSAADDAVRALVSLGYSPAVARKATDEAAAALGADAPVESLVKEGLRRV